MASTSGTYSVAATPKKDMVRSRRTLRLLAVITITVLVATFLLQEGEDALASDTSDGMPPRHPLAWHIQRRELLRQEKRRQERASQTQGLSVSVRDAARKAKAEVEGVPLGQMQEAERGPVEGATGVPVSLPTGASFRVLQSHSQLAPLAPAEVRVEVIDPQPGCQYSVTFESHRVYSGTARLLARDGEGGALVYAWRPAVPADYAVLVHEIGPFSDGKRTPLIPPSPFPLSVAAAAGAGEAWRAALMARLQDTAPCPSLDSSHAYARWNGDWLGPDFPLADRDFPPADRLRTGWHFLPSAGMGCRLEVYPTELLRALPEKRRIYILGRSVERGVFMSLVDLVLNKGEKKMLKHSAIGKCWGRALVAKGNLEVLYQDFRVNSFEDPTEPRFLECHNEKLVKQAGSSFIHNASLVWDEIFDQDVKDTWPDVVFLVTGHGAAKFKFDHHVRYFVDHLPPSWRGTLFLGDFQFSARGAGLMDADHYSAYLDQIAGYVEALADPRVRWLDGVGLSREMRMYGQKGPNYVARSQHFHRPCLKKDKDDPRNEAMVVCSNVTEMVGQLLLSHALGPKEELMKQINTNRGDGPAGSDLRWCHACPRCMLPFHITPYPRMECVEGPLIAKAHEDCSALRSLPRGRDIDPLMCPEGCLGMPATDSFVTESDTVYVRQCPLEKN